ncbi:circadian phase modifier CpmA [Synechococcus sp. BS56D]|jgi:NCAIR mutase (PurE)-related protein|uniref:nickel pincer cofactor biosynthesis protein LarB n=1 Tax=Synechococcus sp. BS56D TaxID=2055944 RepID=UPI00103CA3C2|nr:nickel pincer cofactor biosynthesis protein LarB [Synechococcus sp. BS56D]NDD46041.1 nickel pincer cofactor biosynthesis protein LarB [Synechococcaceae bacterium WB9_4xB_025]TCD56717.1 circadian phase modifier CpmA [Synechococcus sp. BS56D]
MTLTAHLDWDRRRRLGISEAIWGEHKTAEQIAAILESFHGRGEAALVTRVDAAKAADVAALLPDLRLQWHDQARCLSCGHRPLDENASEAPVTILSGGTSDLPVAKEAQLALEFHGVAASLMLDVGVAGLHRLLERLPLLRSSRVLIACAGMEGALPTVLAGLMPQPVIGVPVSVGYGVSAGGRAALDGMLASCAPGLAVVNIDNGYGAAMAALRILQASVD